MAHRGLHERLGSRLSVLLQEILLQGAAVDTNPDGDAVLLRRVDDCLDPVLAPDVARVDPEAVSSVLGDLERDAVVKVNVRNKRNRRSFPDLPECLCRLHCWNGYPDYVSAGLCRREDLGYGGLNVLRPCVCHGLDAYGSVTADCDLPDMNLPGRTALYW